MNTNTPTTNRCRLTRYVQSTQHARGGVGGRGIAMILVLISVSVALVIAGVALTTRDTTSAIGQNATSTSKANWAAESAANIAASVISKNINTWTDAVTTDLMSDWAFADADVTVTVTNAAGLEPTPTDEILIMTITATSGGITKQIVKEVAVTQPVDLSGAINPMLGEFAIFATERLEIANASTVRVWPGCPTSSSRPEVDIGGNFASILDVNIDPTNLYMVRFFPISSGALAVQDMTTDPSFDGGDVVPVNIPTYNTPWSPGLDIQPNMGDVLITGSGNTITLDGATDPLVFMDSLTIDNGAKLIIAGAVEMYVQNDITVDDASFVFENQGASLKLFTGHQVIFQNNAFVGTRDVPTREDALVSNHHADHLQIIVRDEAFQNGHASPTIRVTNALVSADIRAARADVRFENNAILIGRLTARRAAFDNASLFYDPKLGTDSGFTNLAGPCYDQVTSLPVAGLQNALDTFNWTLGEGLFSTWITTQVADDPNAGSSGGVQLLSDTDGTYTSVFEGNFQH